MKECENCMSSTICDWEENEKGGRATPIYWCERLNVFCDEVTHCQHLDICTSDSHFKVTVEVPHGDEYPMRFTFGSVAAAEHWIKKNNIEHYEIYEHDDIFDDDLDLFTF